MLIITPWLKEALAHEPLISGRYDFGMWTIFTLRGPLPSVAEVLRYRPALVFASPSVKMRRRNDLGFIRLAEEQFESGWFDVLLAVSNDMRIDGVPELENFGSLILVDADGNDAAFQRLKTFSRDRLLVLLGCRTPLCRRIESSQSRFEKLAIISVDSSATDGWVQSTEPTFRYGATPPRSAWIRVRRLLDQ